MSATENTSARDRHAYLYLLAGFLAGLFVGYRLLPSLLPSAPPPPLPAAQLQALQSERQHLQAELEDLLRGMDGIEGARVLLSAPLSASRSEPPAASVQIASGSAALSAEQIAGIATQVAAAVDGLRPGAVTIVDAQGRHLNQEALAGEERRQLWTKIAINVAKILGILAMLVTIRYIVEALRSKKT